MLWIGLEVRVEVFMDRVRVEVMIGFRVGVYR